MVLLLVVMLLLLLLVLVQRRLLHDLLRRWDSLLLVRHSSKGVGREGALLGWLGGGGALPGTLQLIQFICYVGRWRCLHGLVPAGSLPRNDATI
jgi:hypothetical protein